MSFINLHSFDTALVALFLLWFAVANYRKLRGMSEEIKTLREDLNVVRRDLKKLRDRSNGRELLT